MPELCKPYTPGKAEQDMSLRLLRIERIIEAALPQYCTPDTPHTLESLHNMRSSQGTDEENNSDQEGTFQSGKWYGNSAVGSIAPANLIEQLEHAVRPDSRSASAAQIGEQSSPSPMDRDRPSLITSPTLEIEPSAADNLQLLVQDCGVSPHQISELLQELPPQRMIEGLIDFYFRSINWTRYPLAEDDFRASYASVCTNSRLGGGATNVNDIRFLPLLFVVLAIAARLSPEHLGGDAHHRRVTSLHYYWSSRRSLLIAAAIQNDSLDIVLARLLSARFLTFDRRITECWSQLGAAVRTAQALGLHRDGTTMRMESSLIEHRRRIWSYLYHADRSYALVLGRPHAIQDDYTSTLPPLNVDDSNPAHLRNPPPLSVPTPMTFVILRQSLAAIIGRMVHHFQKVRPSSHYADVLALDDELTRFIAKLPPHFSLVPDRSLDESHNYIPAHRFLLITEILFVRISLHRPYLLRKLHTDRYARSRSACFESALKDFEVRKAFRQTCPKTVEAPLSNAYREFQTAMISGIYLVLDPRGPDAASMHDILDAFLTDNEGPREMDETTKREVKIIQFFKKKASEVETHGYRTYPQSSSTSSLNDHHAHLLLSLQGQGPGTPRSLTRASSQDDPHPSVQHHTHLRSPTTVQRFQHSIHTDGMATSPINSSSPGTEDEPSAQLLLDNWCNSVSNGAGIDYTGMTTAWPPAHEADSGWAGPSPAAMNTSSNPPLLHGYDGNDWTYWETLVNHIQRGP